MAFLSRDRERELIKRWQSVRCQTAFNEVYKAFSYQLDKWSRNRRNPDDARQIVSIALMRAMDTFDLSRGLRLYTHFAWAALAELKKHPDTRRKRQDEMTVLDHETEDGDTMAVGLIDMSTRDKDMFDLRGVLQSSAASLTNRQRMVLTARANDFTYQELADMIGVSQQRVHQIYKEAGESMRDTLPPSIVEYMRPAPADNSGLSALFNG